MWLWVILTLMTVLATLGLAVPLIRRRDGAVKGRADTLSVLKDQLGELEAQAEAGSIPAAEAEALKTDLKRRVLAEARQGETAARPLSERALLIVALAVVSSITLAGTGLYLALGRPDLPGRPTPAEDLRTAKPDASTDHPQGDVAAMIGQLEAQMRSQPGNVEGWRMLGWSYLQTGRNAEAAEAYGRAAALEPDNVEYLSAQGEATVLAAQSQVTPAAEAIFRRALSLDAADPRSRYYLAVARDQRGDRDGAMNDWIALLRSAPPGAPWAAEVRGMVERIAAERGINIASRLPPAAPIPAEPGAPGPTAAQVAEAQAMSEADRQQMIAGMVSGLAERLKQNPRDRAGWERLLRARMVLGQTSQAAADYRAASAAFAGSPGDQQALREVARQVGVPVS
jgi:cytochrome c-type biogenesis protein CcmH